MTHLKWIDWTVLLAYFVTIFSIGIYASRKIHGMEDYYLGGRRFGKAMMIMYSFGAGTHADTAVGISAECYKLGMAGIWYQWIQIFNTPFYWLLSPVFRRSRCLTIGDIYEMRFGPTLGILYGFMGAVINMGYLGVTLLGSGRVIEALTGGSVRLSWCIVIMTGAFVCYCLIGGMVAVVWNELFQGVLTIVMSFLLLPFLWKAIGGLAGVHIHVPHSEDFFSLVAPGQIGVYWIVASAINQMFTVVAQPQMLSTNAAGRSELDNRIGFCAGVTLKRICTIAWALSGALAVAYYGSGKLHGDLVFGSLVRDLLPMGFTGLMLAGIMASVMDNGSVFMLTSSALFTRNLMRSFRREGQGTLELQISRIFSVVFVSASVAIALSFDNVPAAIRFMWTIAPLIGIPFWLGLFWRRATPQGAWASFVTAMLAMIIGRYVFGWTSDAAFPNLIALYLGTGLFSGITVSFLTRPESSRKLDHFYLTIHTPIGRENRLRRFEEFSQEVANEASA